MGKLLTEPKLEVSDKAPLLEEKTIILLMNPEDNNQFLVNSKNKKEFLEFDYSPKSGSLNQHINNSLNKTFSNPSFIDYTKKLFCVFDEIYLNTIYRVFLCSGSNLITNTLPDTLEFIDLKELTKKDNPKQGLYLRMFLKMFSDLDTIKYFKNS